MKYLVLIEPTNTGFSAHSPDLPGCIATGGNREEVLENMREAVNFHIEGMKLEGLSVPEPRINIDFVDIPTV